MARILGGILVGLLVLGGVELPVLGREPVRVASTGAAQRTIAILGEAYQARNAGAAIVVVPGLGSRGALRGLLGGQVDLAVSAQPPSAEEAARGLVAQELARTPLVWAVAADSAPAGITLADLVEIYAGRRLTWPDGSRVRPILRPPGDSDTEALRAVSPAMSEAVAQALARPGLRTAVTDQEAADAIASTPGAVGTSTLALILSERRPLRALAVDGVAPTPQTLARRDYPYAKTFYLVTARDASRPTQEFAAFLRSPTTRELLGSLGYWVRMP